jgi:hypothetical protein
MNRLSLVVFNTLCHVLSDKSFSTRGRTNGIQRHRHGYRSFRYDPSRACPLSPPSLVLRYRYANFWVQKVYALKCGTEPIYFRQQIVVTMPRNSCGVRPEPFGFYIFSGTMATNSSFREMVYVLETSFPTRVTLPVSACMCHMLLGLVDTRRD